MQDARSVALDQNQVVLVRCDDIARTGVAVERQQLRAKSLAQSDWMPALPCVSGRDEISSRFELARDRGYRRAFDQC